MNTLDIKDLQIGSYIGCGPITHEVFGIHSSQMVQIRSNDSYGLLVWIRDYHPIPITSEWLVRFNLEAGPIDSYITVDESSTREFYVGELKIITNSKKPYCDVYTARQHFMEVYSVHQLQQVVWLLEREWLSLTPTSPS